MDHPAFRDLQHSSPRSFVSTGIATTKSMSRLTPNIKHLPKPMTSAEILETHKLPPMNIPDFSVTGDEIGDEHEGDSTDIEASSMSEHASNADGDTSDGDDGNPQQAEGSSGISRKAYHTKRQSIIDPSTVRLSFAGTISSLEAPLLLEEGLQKLYRLYQRATTETGSLPYSVSITEVPLTTIADRLEVQLRDQHDALEHLAALDDTISLARRDLKNLELHYSLARQEANMRAMTPREARLRIDWLTAEIKEINCDKETLLRQCREFEIENQQLKGELTEMKRLQEDLNKEHHRMYTNMQEELVDATEKLKDLQSIFQSMPSTLRRLWARVLPPTSEAGQENGTPATQRRRSSKFSFY